MAEMIIPLDWEYIDKLLAHIDSQLTESRFPTVLRLRAQLVAEELFRSLMDLDGAASGKMRFTRSSVQTFVLQYHSAQGPLAPSTAILESIQNTPALYGVKMQLSEGSCTVTVGVK